MKLSGIADDTELKLAGTSGDMEQKRKNTVSLPYDLNNVTVKHTQAGDIADRNRRVKNPRVQTGGLRPKDVAAAMKAAAVSGAGVNSNVWAAGATADAMRAGSEGGTSYGATRPDSFSDATQNTNDALITNNPGDVHLGGIVSPGSKIYGELPKEDSTFYINQKFEEVEPFPIMMPDGNLYNSRTSNLNKAEWQFWSDKVSAPDMGWAGYFKVSKPEGEAWVQTAIRSAYNLIPEMAFSAGQYAATAINTASYLYDWVAKDHDRALENYNYYQDMIEDTVRDYMDATKWYYSDASEEGANKYAIIVGQTLGSVGVASLGTRAAVAALAAGEGLSDAASVQRATRELGYSPLASLGAGALAGGVTAGLSFLPEYVYPNELDNLAKKTGKSLLSLAVRSPGAISKAVAQNGWRRVILEAGTEVGQELFADYASTGFDSEKTEARWDEKVAIILASLVMGGAGLYHNITKANKGEAELREFGTKMNDMIKAVEPELRRIASESGGLINDSNIDEILAHIKDPDFALQMTNIIRESVVGNFDKFSPEEKTSLMEKIKSWDGEALLSEEFAKLESRVDELLKDSGLTAAQKERFRTYIRGTAAWQLATLGIKPSQMELPVSVSATPVDSNVAGFTRDSDGAIFVTTRGADLPVSALYGRVPAKPRNRSARQSADMSGRVAVADMTNTDTAQTVGEAFATHEFTHWIQKNTGLHGVDAYMKALTNAVETMMPGLLKSLEAKPSRGGNKDAVKAEKKQRKLDVSKAEAYAYVMQYAGEKAAEIMGTEGKVADVMSFMNMMLKASDASTKLSPQLQKVFDLFESTMKENKKLMDALIAEIPYEQLRGAIRDFVETGDPSNIGLDAIRALHVVLNSIVDGETSDLLGQVFTNRAVAEDFMNAVNTYYSDKAKAEREAERAARDEVIKEADAIVGIVEEEAPVVNTVEDAVVEGVMDEADNSKAESEPKSTLDQKNAEGKTTLKTVGLEPIKFQTDSPKVAADQDVKEWVESPVTGKAAEDRTRATKNIEEMAEQKLLEWRVHIPEIIRTELTTPVDDDLELVWSDSSDETPFKFSSTVRKDPKKRAQLHARLKQYYKTIVSEVNRRIESGEMSAGGEQFISKNGLFAVWNPNMLWSDDYMTHLAYKIAGRLEGQVATESEKQLYRAIREYEKNIAFLYDGYATDYLAVPRVEPYQRSFPGMGYKEHMSDDTRRTTGKTVRTVSDQLVKLEQEKSSLLKEQKKLQKDEKALLNELSGYDRFLDGVIRGSSYDTLSEKDKAEYDRITREREAVLSDRDSVKARLAKIKREIPKLDAKLKDELSRLELESISESIISSTGNLVGTDDVSMISENTAERVYSAIDYLQDLEEALSAISVSDDPKLLGFLYGLNEQNARRIAYKEIGEQYANATKRLSMRDLTNKDYYKSRNMWLQDGLIKRVQNRIDWLQGKIPSLLTEYEQLKALSDSHKKELTDKVAPIDVNAIEDKIDQLTKMLEEAPKQAADLEKMVESLENDYLSELEKTEDPSKYNKKLDRAAERLYNAKQKLASVKSYEVIIPKQIQRLQDSIVGGGAKPLYKDLLKLFAHDNDDAMFAELNARNRELAAVSGDPYYNLSDKAYKVNVDKNGRPTEPVAAAELAREERSLAIREELGSLKKAYLEAKAEHKKALDAYNAKPTRTNNDKLLKATEAAKAARNKVIRAGQRYAELLEYVPVDPDIYVHRFDENRLQPVSVWAKLPTRAAASRFYDEAKSVIVGKSLHAGSLHSPNRLMNEIVYGEKTVKSIVELQPKSFYPSIARFFSPKRLGGGVISQNMQDEKGNDLLLKTDESKWAQFINPAKPERVMGRTHPVTTPTPLEQIELETGFTFADAQSVVLDAGLTIPALDLSDVTPEKIARYYDDGVATFSRVYARLLDQVASWGGAGSWDYAKRMRILVGIDIAKQTARDIVGEYQLSKEIGFLQNPTRGLGITESAVKFDQSEKGAAVRAENAKQGYIAVANPYELRPGDQVAFAKGNKIVKAVVSYVMPVGPNKSVFLRHLVDVSDIDVDNMTRAEMSELNGKMIEDVISASDLSKVAVMQKVAVKGDAERIGKMFDAYDKVFGAFERDNFTLEAFDSVPPETLQGQIAADILENMQSVYDPYENSDEDDFGGNGMYAIMPDIVPSTPAIDPGKFVVRNLDTINPDTTNPITLSDEEFRELLGDPEEFEARLKAEAQLTQDQARSAVMDVAMNAAKDYLRDMNKPAFSSVMNDTAFSGRNQMYGMTPLKQFNIVDKGLNETKTWKFLYLLGATTGLDRKLAMNIGQKNAQEAFGFIEAASVAQQEKESRMQAMIDNAVEAVFGGKRTAYDRWRIGIKNDSIEATVEGVKQKVSEAEIMSLYAMSKKPTMPGGKSQFERASVPFGGVDAARKLIEQLSPESKSFVDLIGSGTMAGISQHPEWVPAVEFGQYRGSGWASRKKNKVDYIPAFELVNSDTPLAALDYYDSVTKAITKYAMDASGLRTQLENLQMIFEFDKRVDRSKFAPIMPGSADEKLFNEMSRRSKLMRDKLAEKIGTRMANAFIKNIEYDLKNPAFLDDVAATPEAKWFGRFSRSSGASVLMLNTKQGLQNLGNYHRLFGLSGSNMFKYYITDWVKAVIHTREAWALMKQNPELLRRLKQAGLSEHMMRVVDENADSIFTDIQAEFLKHGRNKASNVTAFLGTVSNMATKWGMAPNVFGDALGLAWGNYAVYDHVRSQVSAANKPTLLKRRDGADVEAAIDMLTQREIGNYINSHISSSNYMARSMFTKMMNKMGLGALVMFTNDQLQGFGSLAQAISVLQNSKDKIELERARKDIIGWAVSTVRYIAIKAGWYSALAAMAMGKDLSDDEMDYIWDSTISEAVMQMGGWHQLSNLGIAPVLRAIIDGDRLGPSIVSVSAAGRGISAARRGDWWDFASEAASMTFFPVANGLSRIVEAMNYVMSSNEYEQQVGLKMLGGSSKGGAMESLGLSDKNEDKEVKPKKKLKKDGE